MCEAWCYRDYCYSSFLLAAGHVKKDIPFELEKLTNQFLNVKVTYGNPFGVSETLVKSVYSGSGIEQEDKNEVTLLLVARGAVILKY